MFQKSTFNFIDFQVSISLYFPSLEKRVELYIVSFNQVTLHIEVDWKFLIPTDRQDVSLPLSMQTGQKMKFGQKIMDILNNPDKLTEVVKNSLENLEAPT